MPTTMPPFQKGVRVKARLSDGTYATGRITMAAFLVHDGRWAFAVETDDGRKLASHGTRAAGQPFVAAIAEPDAEEIF